MEEAAAAQESESNNSQALAAILSAVNSLSERMETQQAQIEALQHRSESTATRLSSGDSSDRRSSMLLSEQLRAADSPQPITAATTTQVVVSRTLPTPDKVRITSLDLLSIVYGLEEWRTWTNNHGHVANLLACVAPKLIPLMVTSYNLYHGEAPISEDSLSAAGADVFQSMEALRSHNLRVSEILIEQMRPSSSRQSESNLLRVFCMQSVRSVEIADANGTLSDYAYFAYLQGVEEYIKVSLRLLQEVLFKVEPRPSYLPRLYYNSALQTKEFKNKDVFHLIKYFLLSPIVGSSAFVQQQLSKAESSFKDGLTEAEKDKSSTNGSLTLIYRYLEKIKATFKALQQVLSDRLDTSAEVLGANQRDQPTLRNPLFLKHTQAETNDLFVKMTSMSSWEYREKLKRDPLEVEPDAVKSPRKYFPRKALAVLNNSPPRTLWEPPTQSPLLLAMRDVAPGELRRGADDYAGENFEHEYGYHQEEEEGQGELDLSSSYHDARSSSHHDATDDPQEHLSERELREMWISEQQGLEPDNGEHLSQDFLDSCAIRIQQSNGLLAALDAHPRATRNPPTPQQKKTMSCYAFQSGRPCAKVPCDYSHDPALALQSLQEKRAEIDSKMRHIQSLLGEPRNRVLGQQRASPPQPMRSAPRQSDRLAGNRPQR